MPDPPSASIMAATDVYRCPVRAVGTYAGTTDGYKEGKLQRRKTTSGGEGVEVIPAENGLPVTWPCGFGGKAWEDLEETGISVRKAEDRVSPQPSADLNHRVVQTERGEVHTQVGPWYRFLTTADGLVVH